MPSRPVERPVVGGDLGGGRPAPAVEGQLDAQARRHLLEGPRQEGDHSDVARLAEIDLDPDPRGLARAGIPLGPRIPVDRVACQRRLVRGGGGPSIRGDLAVAVLLEPEAAVEPPAEGQRLGGPDCSGRRQAPVEARRRADGEVRHPRSAVHALGERRVPLLVEMRDRDLLGAQEREDTGLRIVRVHRREPGRLELLRDGEKRGVHRALDRPALGREHPRVGGPEPRHLSGQQRDGQGQRGEAAPRGERRQQDADGHGQHRHDGDEVERLREPEVLAVLGEDDHRRAKADDAGDEPPARSGAETGAGGGGEHDQARAREPGPCRPGEG